MGDPKATLAKLLVALGKPARDNGICRAGARASLPRGERREHRSLPATPCRSCRTGCAPRSPRHCPRMGFCGRYWVFRHLDQHADRAERHLADLSARRWFAGSGRSRPRLGRSVRRAKRKVICWSGDGAIYYHLTELETARRRGHRRRLVINNNSGFGQGWPNIQRQQGNRPGDVRDLVRFGPTNFADWHARSACAASAWSNRRRSRRHCSDALASDETRGGRCRDRHRCAARRSRGCRQG